MIHYSRFLNYSMFTTELEIQSYVPVKTTCKEDSFAVEVYNIFNIIKKYIVRYIFEYIGRFFFILVVDFYYYVIIIFVECIFFISL